MFREMRRNKQLMSHNESIEVLQRGTSGVLALLGDDDFPYTVPLSYVYADGKIYFHSAKTGHKIDAIKKCDKASFCVIDQDKIVPEKYTTHFRSVVAFGKIRLLDSDKEMRQAVEKLAFKYHPTDSRESREQAIDKDWKPLCMMEFSIEHMTGKEAIEMVKGKK